MPGEQLPFDWAREPAAPAGGAPLGERLRPRLQQLAERGVYLGGSSWKYPGWLGQVYDEQRYRVRGRFAQRTFERECLVEYAAVFPTVCGDFAFYQWPSDEMWAHTFSQLPANYRFSLKVCEEVTVDRYPKLPRYGGRAGEINREMFNATLVQRELLDRLQPYRDQVGVLILEFGQIQEGPLRAPEAFAGALDRMLADLPTREWRFAVEVRNADFIEQPSPLLACLEERNVAYCFNSWTRMPPIEEQLRLPDVLTANFTCARYLLRPGRTYQQAVDQFSPYEHIQEPYPEGRQSLTDLIERCLGEQRMLFAFVNNRFEGNAPETIDLALPSAAD